jgi:hypothetical protein
MACNEDVFTFPTNFMAIYDTKIQELAVAVDEFDSFELYETDARAYSLLSFKYGDIIVVKTYDV